jgi:hypothetical protein
LLDASEELIRIYREDRSRVFPASMRGAAAAAHRTPWRTGGTGPACGGFGRGFPPTGYRKRRRAPTAGRRQTRDLGGRRSGRNDVSRPR